jgi:hypothetical protein
MAHMGCGCGKRQDSALAGTTLRQSATVPNSKGLYDLASHPDCDVPYHGAFPAAQIYVVGFGTEAERLYVRGQRNEATRAARTGKDPATGEPLTATGGRLTLDPVLASNLCHDAVVELLGS